MDKQAYTFKVELTITIYTRQEIDVDRVKERMVGLMDKAGQSVTTVQHIVRVDHLGGYAKHNERLPLAPKDALPAYTARVKTSDDKRRWVIFDPLNVMYGKPHYSLDTMKNVWVSKYQYPSKWVSYGDLFEQSELAATIATIQEEHGTKGE